MEKFNLNNIPFNRICKYCGREILLSRNGQSYRTIDQNSFGWRDICWDYPDSEEHTPFTNVEWLEYLYVRQTK